MEINHKLVINFLRDQGFTDQNVKVFTMIDVHTGLGPSGVDTFLVDSKKEVEKLESMMSK